MQIPPGPQTWASRPKTNPSLHAQGAPNGKLESGQILCQQAVCAGQKTPVHRFQSARGRNSGRFCIRTARENCAQRSTRTRFTGVSCGRRGCAKKLRCASFSARALLFLILPILAPPIHLNVDISCTLHCCRPVQLKSKKAGWVVFDSCRSPVSSCLVRDFCWYWKSYLNTFPLSTSPLRTTGPGGGARKPATCCTDRRHCGSDRAHPPGRITAGRPDSC